MSMTLKHPENTKYPSSSIIQTTCSHIAGFTAQRHFSWLFLFNSKFNKIMGKGHWHFYCLRLVILYSCQQQVVNSDSRSRASRRPWCNYCANTGVVRNKENYPSREWLLREQNGEKTTDKGLGKITHIFRELKAARWNYCTWNIFTYIIITQQCIHNVDDKL